MKLKESIVLVILLVIGWQLLYLIVGDVALRSPYSTVQNLRALLEDARFLPHVRETALAFAQGFAIAVVLGLLIGVPLGAARFAGEGGVRRAARHRADLDLRDERDSQHQSHASENRTQHEVVDV